jgi:sugar phosphate isomerase/epimerase
VERVGALRTNRDIAEASSPGYPYVHIKDIDISILDAVHRNGLNFREAVEAGVFSQIGEGCVHFPVFFRTLEKNGYQGWCVVEQDIKFGVSTVSPKASMGASLQYLHNVIKEVELGRPVDSRHPTAVHRETGFR